MRKNFFTGKGPRPEASADTCQPEHVYLYANGTRLHYQVAGPSDAPPLVLLHGVGGCVNWWQHNFAAFSQHFRTYALDLPGFGQTWRLREASTIEGMAAFVRNWLNLLGLEQVSLLGHSMGGQVAARLVASHPESVERLVLVAPSGLWLPTMQRVRWPLAMPKVAVPLQQTLTIATGTMRTDVLALSLSVLALLADRASVASLEKLSRPTLILWGTADGILPPALGPRTLELIRHAPARLEYIERGTHNLMFDQSASFNRAVLNFLLEDGFAKELQGTENAIKEPLVSFH